MSEGERGRDRKKSGGSREREQRDEGRGLGIDCWSLGGGARQREGHRGRERGKEREKKWEAGKESREMEGERERNIPSGTFSDDICQIFCDDISQDHLQNIP